MKEDISWHKQCLKNREKGLRDTEKRIWELQKAISREREEISFYKIQITMAESQGKKDFDREKFCNNLKPKSCYHR